MNMQKIVIKLEDVLRSRQRSDQGFSLIELLVTIAIISLLAVAGVFGYIQYIQQAKKAVNESNAKQLADALAAEAVSPVVCNDATSRINNEILFRGNIDEGVLDHPLVVCANKLIAQNFTNPYTNNPYSKLNQLNRAVDADGYLIGDGSSNPGHLQVLNSDATTYINGVYEGNKPASYLSFGFNATGPIFCSDQLNGNPFLDEGGNLIDPSYKGDYGAGLIIVEAMNTNKYGVATCNPYVNTGVIDKIFIVNSDMPIR